MARTKRIEAQAFDAKLATVSAIGSRMMKSVNQEAKQDTVYSSEAYVNFDSKMPSPPQQDSHHRVCVESDFTQPPPSFDGGLGTENLTAELSPDLIH